MILVALSAMETDQGAVLAPPPGLCVLAAWLSLPAMTAGCVVLRASRPSGLDDGHLRHMAGSFKCQLAGGVLVFTSLVLRCLPMPPHHATDAEVRLAHLAESLILPCFWAAERFVLQRRPLPVLQSLHFVWIFLCVLLFRLGEPRPFDNLDEHIAGEIMGGCDSGYRFFVRFYLCIFITLVVLGIALQFPTDAGFQDRFAALRSDCSPPASESDSDASPAALPAADTGPPPSSLRKKLSPFLFGGFVSFAVEAAQFGAVNESWAAFVFMVLLLVLATVLTFDWLCRMELTLGSWGPASQLFLILVGYLQGVCLFTDFRWAGEDEGGYFSMPMQPGVWLMTVGVVIALITFPVFLDADDTVEWGSAYEDDDDAHSPGYKERVRHRRATMAAMVEARRPARVVVCLLLPVCLLTMFMGITQPMAEVHLAPPKIVLLPDELRSPGRARAVESGPVPPSTTALQTVKVSNFMNVIVSSYKGHVPMSAISVIWLAFRSTTLLVIQTVLVVARPSFVSAHQLQGARDAIVHGASGRLINPMINMLAIAWLNYSDPSQGAVQITFGAGFWYLVMHAFSVIALALFVEVDADKLDRVDRARTLTVGQVHDDGGDGSDDSDAPRFDPKTLKGAAVLALTGVTVVAMYVGFTNPFLIIKVRIEGVLAGTSYPNLVDLWNSLMIANSGVGRIAACTVLGAMLVWVPLLFLALHCSNSRCALISERTARQWVMGHQWMQALLLPYLILTIKSAHSDALVEACYQLPLPPYAPLGIVVMGVGVIALQSLGRSLTSAPASRPPPPRKGGLKIPRLPGGNMVWAVCLGSVFCATFYKLISTAPKPVARFKSLAEANENMGYMQTYINDQLKANLPESMGNCQALRAYREKQGLSETNRDTKCIGDKDLANNTAGSVLFRAKWITGIDTMRVTRMELLPPSNEDASFQKWNFEIDGQLTDLHVWLKIGLSAHAWDSLNAFEDVFDFGNGAKVWFDDNMCCTNPFKFTIQASAECFEGYGFRPVKMDIPRLDPIEIKHTVDKGKMGSYEANYGSYSVVQDALRKLFQAKTSQVRVQMGDSTIVDPMDFISKKMEELVRLNTGKECPTAADFNIEA